MYTNDILDQLKNDSTLGAGNFLYKLRDYVDNTHEKTIFLDTPFTDHHGKAWTELSVDDILTLADELSNWYLDNNIGSKEPVVLFFDDGVAYYIHFVALTSIGAIPVHLNPHLNLEVASGFIDRTSTVAAIVDASHTSLKDNTSIPVYELSEINTEKAPRKQPVFEHDADDPVMLVHTSGTTGLPKAVRSDHLGMIYGVLKQLKGNVGTRILTALPHSHGSGINIIMSAILRGANILVQTKKAPLEMFDAIQNFQADMVIAFPKTFVDMCRHDLSEIDLHCVSYWLAIGDANHEPHIRKLVPFGKHMRKGKEHNGSVFIDNLGSSEIAYAAFKKVHSLYDTGYGREIGTTFDWMDVAILDEQGNKVEDNTVGYIGIKAECITKGYWNNTFLSEKNRLNGYWLTGDLAYRTSEGRYFHMDRVTDKINTEEGPLYSCFTEELILSNFPDVFECSIIGMASDRVKEKPMVVGVKTEQTIEKPVMAIELAENAKHDISELGEKINALLVERNIPTIDKFVPDDPVNYVGVTGKRLKRRMREEIAAHA